MPFSAVPQLGWLDPFFGRFLHANLVSTGLAGKKADLRLDFLCGFLSVGLIWEADELCFGCWGCIVELMRSFDPRSFDPPRRMCSNTPGKTCNRKMDKMDPESADSDEVKSPAAAGDLTAAVDS